MIESSDPTSSIRKKIEEMGISLTLPTVRKALGVIEGEHSSHRRFGTDDVMDIRPYIAGDEARLIEWKTSARTGEPMVVQRERLVTSHVWLLLDGGREMTGSCAEGEHAYDVAANALRMFASLSLRRSDAISLVVGDANSITRVPFNGGFRQFEHTLDLALRRDWDHARNIDALLDYAVHIKDRHALVVLATDEMAVRERHLPIIRRIARTHPTVFIDVETINPFVRNSLGAVLDSDTNRRIPAFLIDEQTALDVRTHREFLASALERELTRAGSTMIRSGSSSTMFDAFVHLVSSMLAGSTPNTLRAAPPLHLGGIA